MFNGVSVDNKTVSSYLQVSSNFEVSYDSTAKIGSRLISLKLNGQAIILFDKYTVGIAHSLRSPSSCLLPDRNEPIPCDRRRLILPTTFARPQQPRSAKHVHY